MKRIFFSAGTSAARSRRFGRCTPSAPIPVRMLRSGPYHSPVGSNRRHRRRTDGAMMATASPAHRTTRFEADLSSGDGNELETKFRAADSSSGLAVNCFAPFRRRIAELMLPKHVAFDELQSERSAQPVSEASGHQPRCLAFGPRRRGRNRVQADRIPVGAQGRGLAYLRGADQGYAARPGHFREVLRLWDRPDNHTWLDAAQLIKHAFGLTSRHGLHGPLPNLWSEWSQ